MRTNAPTAATPLARRRPPTVTIATFAALGLVVGSGGAAIALTDASPQQSAPLSRAAAPPTVPGPDQPATGTGAWHTVDTEDTPAVEPRYDAPVEVIGVAEPHVASALASPGAEKVVEIPASALSAYLATEQVLARADRTCRVRWTLVAAIGRVLSDHGEPGRHRLTRNGTVTPELRAKRLTDRRGRLLRDTDAGQIDNDRRGDRGVGPMLLDPTTWSTVGVDGDANGRRNPQDVDDAALAVGVILCAGREDLREREQRRAAVRRLSDEPGFARNVLRVAHAYWVDLHSHATGLAGPQSFTFARITPHLAVPPVTPAGDPAGEPGVAPTVTSTEEVEEALDETDGELLGGATDGSGTDSAAGGGGEDGATPDDDSGEPSDPAGDPDVVDPPADPDVVDPPADPDPVDPPADLDVVEPPAEPDVVEPPAEPEPSDPPAEPDAVDPPAGPDEGSAGGNDPAPEPEQPDGVCRPEEDLSARDPDCEQEASSSSEQE